MDLFKNINYNHPIVFGLIAGLVTYIILLLDSKFENKRIKLKNKLSDDCNCPMLKPSIKLPLIIGALVWATATYFKLIYNKTVVVEKTVLTGTTSPTLNNLTLSMDDGDFNIQNLFGQ